MLLKTESPETEIPFTDYVTLRHGGFAQFDGETYRRLDRVPGAKWSALRLERDRLSANFQGNPLWPHKALARYPKLSVALGLSGAFNEDSCFIPDARTANKHLSGVGPGGFQFRDCKSMSDREYVDMFIDDRVLPMADILDRDSVHDWAYHFVTFLFPEYLKNVRLNLEWIRAHLHRFEGRVTRGWNYYGHNQDADDRMIVEVREEKTAWEEAIYRQMAISLDVCTAKIVQILCMDERGLLPRCLSELKIISDFAKGITDESLATILWLEPKLAKILPAPSATAGTLPEDPMEYLRSRLSALETSCPAENAERSRFFETALAPQPVYLSNC